MEIQKNCKCGKEHTFSSEVMIGEGVLKEIPQILKKYNTKKVFFLADKNTYIAAGKAVEEIIKKEEMVVASYIFQADELEPNEVNVGLAIMHYEADCDVIIGVGSGVINDISKIVANVSNKTYIIVATAPSMDGYASATSSMTRNGLKISLPSKCADVIIGDLDVLCEAPMKLMISGLGDMLAKYVSICEWRISALINGEYYCEEIAKLVRSSLKRCVDNAAGLLQRDKEAVKAVFEGLVVCGVAMKYAGISRPASGCEHYMSHVWDMRGAEFGHPVALHGIQCGVATLIIVKMYEKLIEITPDRQRALNYVDEFDYDKWSVVLKEFLGKAADSMIALEAKEQKYNKESHKVRLDFIINHWDEILQIIKEELPSSEALEKLFEQIGAPKSLQEIGVDEAILPLTFEATKDIRDKYVLSRLCWDLGSTGEL
ncbi:MAG: sn-glycerol-1-phosphate dehydrogenase [Tyzzerella sp.]|nr:sn-glycerol-1-phosphate dehydrogenase [Tyzzerella sp.]